MAHTVTPPQQEYHPLSTGVWWQSTGLLVKDPLDQSLSNTVRQIFTLYSMQEVHAVDLVYYVYCDARFDVGRTVWATDLSKTTMILTI